VRFRHGDNFTFSPHALRGVGGRMAVMGVMERDHGLFQGAVR
jgi:hypothetical protein